MTYTNGTLLHFATSPDGLTFKRLGSTGVLGTGSSVVTMPDGRLRLFHAYSSTQCGNALFSSAQTKVPWKLAVTPDRGTLVRADQPVSGASASTVKLEAGLLLLCGAQRAPQATITVSPASGQPPFTARVQITVDQISSPFRQDVPLTVRATDGTLTQTFTVTVIATP